MFSIHPSLGIGGRVIDSSRGISYPTIALRAISAKLTQESLSEEMRVLYVAMTRPQGPAHHHGDMENSRKDARRAARRSHRPHRAAASEKSASLSRWIALRGASAGQPDQNAHHSCLRRERIRDRTASEIEPAEPGECARLSEALTWEYPYRWAGGAAVEDHRECARGHRRRPGRAEHCAGSTAPAALPPSGLRREGRPAHRHRARHRRTHGSAVYRLFVRIHAGAGARRDRTAEKCRAHHPRAGRRSGAKGHLQTVRLLHRAEDPARGRGLARAALLAAHRRGRPCSTRPPARRCCCRGVADCCIREGMRSPSWIIKTDYVTAETLAARASEYAPQVRAYAAALTRLLGKPVREGVLFFLRTGESVSIDCRAKKIKEIQRKLADSA